jgi:hypothetical protein
MIPWGSFTHYEVALRSTQTPDIVHNNYAKALHELARTTDQLDLFKKANNHFKIAGKLNPNYYSVFLSWGHKFLLERILEVKNLPRQVQYLRSWAQSLLEPNAAARGRAVRIH